MIEFDDDRRDDDKATVHLRKWSPWVWILPVVAIFFVGWLVVRYGFFGGGDITVRFAEARGLDRYSPVRFRGAKVGTVQKITIDDDLREVVVRISMDASMNHALKKGTRFWIVEPGIEGGGLGGILSGTYVGIAPGEGEETREFVGQEYAPVVAAPEAGKTVILEGENVGSIAPGTPVQYHGVRVGRILGAEYDERRGTTAVHAFVVQRFANHVRQGTRFYRGGGFNVSLSGGGLSMGSGGISSLLSSPISFYTPEVLAGAPVAERTRFELYESEGVAMAEAGGPQMTYLTYFPGSLRGLTPGTPVQMKGVQVGRVRDVRLRFVPQNATLETPVTFTIDPTKLEMPVTEYTTGADLRGTLNSAIDRLVQKGMRANLGGSLVLPGVSAITLDMTGTAGTARLNVNSDPPIVPAAAGGSGLEGAMDAIGDVATTIRNLPLREIAADLRSASSRVNTLVNDPALRRSLERLDRSMADVERITGTTRENIGPITESIRNAADDAESAASRVKRITDEDIDPIVQSLRNAASSAETAAARVDQLLGSSVRQNYDLGTLIQELTRTAEAVRALANYLAENPDALLKGRAK